jgi:phosphatidylglycerophosphatase A
MNTSTASIALPRRPDGRFMRQHPAHWIALGFGSGLPRNAPGTCGTIFAWLLFVLADRWLQGAAWAVVIVATVGLGAWAAQRTGAALGVADSSHIVIDEIAAFWIVLAMLPAGSSLPMQLSAFVLFRFFDIVKPPPIRQLDQRIKNGFGVMLDDLVAAFYTLLVIALVLRVIR